LLFLVCGLADNLKDFSEVLGLEDEGSDHWDPVGVGREADDELDLVIYYIA